MAKKTKDSNLSLEERLEQALIPNWDKPYKLPPNWCWTKLESIANWGSGGTPSRKNPEYYIGDIPWVKTGELNNSYIYETEEHISEKAVSNSSAKLFPINTVVIAMYGATIGKVGILGIEATTNQACACGVCSSAVDYKYLFYYAISQRDDFISKGKGGAQPNISQEIIKQHEIPLPPLAEQRRIVSYIESLFSKLDEAKEKAQDVVDGFETRKAAILHKAFSGELTAKLRLEEQIDDNYSEKSIGELFTHTTGKALKKGNTTGLLRMYITTSNVYWGEFDFSEIREMYFTEKELDKCTAHKGDLLICNGGDVGRAAIWEYDYDICLQNHISKLRPKQNDVDVKFIYYYFMNSKMRGAINGKGIGISSLSAKDLLAMRVMLPTVVEQQKIVEILDLLINNELKAKETAEAVIEQIDTMKKAILARAFRGELGTNDPSEESAVELIKQIIEEKIKIEESTPKRIPTRRKEVSFVAKTILDALKSSEKLTPEKLKVETALEIDDFYDQLKVLIDNGQIREIRIDGESYLEAVK